MSNQTTAITPYSRLRDMIRSDDIQNSFRQVLGAKAPGFLASVLSTVATNDYLKDADPNSVIISAMKAAVLDLPIDNNLGFAYIIPYNDTRQNRKSAQFQMGYKGYVQLAMRTGQYADLNATEVYEGQRVKVDQLTGRVSISGERTGDQVIGYAAYFRLINGFEKYIYMTQGEVREHGEKYSKTYGKSNGIWSTNPDAAGRKTVLKRLLSRWGILSIEMRQAMVKDDDEAEPPIWPGNGRDEPIDVRPIDVPEPSISEPVQPETPPEPEPIPEPPAPGPDIYDLIVSAGWAPDAITAQAMMTGCKLKNPTNEQAVEWAKNCRGWLDMGATPKQAHAYANKGEAPK